MLVLYNLICVALYGRQALSAPNHAKQDQGTDTLDYVDPLIGTKSGGNVFAGATLPYGMAKGSRRATQPGAVCH